MAIYADDDITEAGSRERSRVDVAAQQVFTFGIKALVPLASC
jgi:hypothetical protein